MSDIQRDLDRTLMAGLSWNAVARWGGQVISWASTLIVVRLLTPEDYGVAAMAGVLLAFVNLIADGGIGAAIVSRRESDPDRLAQLHSAGILFGLGAALVVAGMSIPLARFFGDPRLVPVVLTTSLSYVIVGFRVVPMAVLQRNLAFKTLARNEFLWITTGASACVAGALLGMGYWALVLGPICGVAAATVAASISAPCRPQAPRWAELVGTIRFGGHLLISRLAGYINGVGDSVVIGRRLGQEALGGYRVAMEIASLPLEKVASVIMQVATPVLASVREEKTALSRYLLLITEALALIGWPLAFGLVLVADLLIPVILGAAWLPAVTPMRLLAVAGAFRCTNPLLNSVIIVRGRSLFLARVAVFSTPLFLAALYLGSYWGVAGVALAWAIGFPVLSAPSLRIVIMELGIPLRRYLGSFAPAATGTAAMATVVLAVRWGLRPHLTDAWLLWALVAAGATTYLASVVVVAGPRLRLIRNALFPGTSAR